MVERKKETRREGSGAERRRKRKEITRTRAETGAESGGRGCPVIFMFPDYL